MNRFQAFARKAKHQLQTNNRLYIQLGMMIVLMLVAQGAVAEFQEFRDAVEDLAGGNFAIAISIAALILGAIMGLAKMSAWPALIGLALAAVFALGPYLIVQIFDWFGDM